VQNMKSFWQTYDQDPVNFEQLVERVSKKLGVAGWQCLITAVEGLLLFHALQHMSDHAAGRLDVDENIEAIRTLSTAHGRSTNQLIAWTSRRQQTTPAPPAWGERELLFLLRLSETGLTRETVPPGCEKAFEVLQRLKAELAAAQVRAKKAARTRAGASGKRTRAVAHRAR
jgi:hypothetical protein